MQLLAITGGSQCSSGLGCISWCDRLDDDNDTVDDVSCPDGAVARDKCVDCTRHYRNNYSSFHNESLWDTADCLR